MQKIMIVGLCIVLILVSGCSIRSYDDEVRYCVGLNNTEPCGYLKCLYDRTQGTTTHTELRADYFQCLYINELAKDLAEDLRCK